MIGRRAVIGLSLLSALLFGAFATQSASALKPAKSNNTTAFTCVKAEPNKGDFKDAHCDEKVAPDTGEYKHDLLNQTTEIDGTNLNITNGTKDKEPAVLKGTLAGAKVEIECETAKNSVKNSTVKNAEPVTKQHTFEGTIETEFTKCNVKLVKNCTVSEPIVSKANLHGVDGMEGPKGEANAMGIEFIGSGAEETFASVEFKGATCPLGNPVVFPVKGSAIGTNGPTTESAQNNKYSGATLVFSPKFKMQTLKLGPNTAEFTAIATPTMAGETTPIALTTTT